MIVTTATPSIVRFHHPHFTSHVGSICGFVQLGASGPLAQHHRELTLLDRDRLHPVERIAASCSCGWRSHRFRVIGASWDHGYLLASPASQDKCERLWQRHIIELHEAEQ
jgi:hypothetical protein